MLSWVISFQEEIRARWHTKSRLLRGRTLVGVGRGSLVPDCRKSHGLIVERRRGRENCLRRTKQQASGENQHYELVTCFLLPPSAFELWPRAASARLIRDPGERVSVIVNG